MVKKATSAPNRHGESRGLNYYAIEFVIVVEDQGMMNNMKTTGK